MATLPTAANVIGAVQPQSAPNVRVPQDAFPNFDDVGDALGKAGRAWAGSIIRENIETEAQDLATQLNTFSRILENGDTKAEDYDQDGSLISPPADPNRQRERGFLNLLNKEAMDRRSEYEQRFEDERKRLEQTATTDAARRMFRKTAIARQEQFLNRVGTHFNDQRKAYRKVVLDTTVAEATESAIVDHENPAHAIDVRNATYNYYVSIGYSDKVAQSLADEARSKLHLAVVKDLGVTNAVAAEAYLKKHKDQIEKDMRAGALKPLMVNVRMQRANEDLAELSSRGNLNTTDGDKAAFKFLREKYKDNPAQLDASEKRLKNELDRLEELEKDKQEDLLLRATKRLQKDPNAPLPDEELNAILATRNGFAYLTNLRTQKRRISDKDSQTAFSEFSDDHAKREKSKTVLTPGQYQLKYYNKMNPREYNAGLSKVRAWHTANTKKNATRQEQAEAQSQIALSKRVKNTLLEAGLISYKAGKTSFNKKTNMRLAAFELRIADKIEEFARDKGSKATTEEISNIINKELVKIVYVDPKGPSLADEARPAAMVVDDLADRVYIPISKLKQGYVNELRDKLMMFNLISLTTPLEVQNKRVEDFAAAVARGKTAQVRYLKALRKQLNDADD